MDGDAAKGEGPAEEEMRRHDDGPRNAHHIKVSYLMTWQCEAKLMS